MATWTHGLTGYATHRCRCDICRAASAAYQRAYKKRPAVKAKIRAYWQRPEVKARIRAYRQQPAVKAQRHAFQRVYRRTIAALARLAKAHGLTLPRQEGPDAPR